MHKSILGLLLWATFLAAVAARESRVVSTRTRFSHLHESLARLQEEEEEEEAQPRFGRDREEDGNGREEDRLDRDPCLERDCGQGRECVLDSKGDADCQCVEECDDMEDDRRRVCSNHNDTWSSDCQLYRMSCYCAENHEKCTNNKLKDLRIDYYGSCQATPNCGEDERADFPRRMREWLFNIMRDLVDRNQLSDHYKRLERIAEQDQDKMWITAAVWKWCEMDGYPKDKSVSKHELFPLRAPLYTLEHCIAPFLDSCDPDGDGKVTLDEWTDCLQLSNEEVDAVDDLCEEIQDQ